MRLSREKGSGLFQLVEDRCRHGIAVNVDAECFGKEIRHRHIEVTIVDLVSVP